MLPERLIAVFRGPLVYDDFGEPMGREIRRPEWLISDWWLGYVLKDNTGWRNVRCRMKGHPDGPWFYNVGGSEPDWRCKGCGEYLG